MIEILSDSDRFTFSETLFMNRMGIGAKAYRASIKLLVECGYIRKSKIGNSNKNFYTISEYGNLNKKEIITNEAQSGEPTSQQKAETVDIPSTPKLSREELLMKLAKFIMPLQDFFTPDIAETYTELIKGDFDVYDVKSELVKMIDKEKKSFLKKVVTEIENCSSNRDTKVEAIKLVKSEVFDNNKMLDCERARKRANENINRRKPLDPESLAADRADGI
ncbi:hypothetical protein ACFQ5N_12585 [Lutibacter holmesii]|uniref:Uncharacterized protein n=1 Tax=Lutibacter holmesii TaxID=1137985 RepID=A0ABW3WSX6_9FLAO